MYYSYCIYLYYLHCPLCCNNVHFPVMRQKILDCDHNAVTQRLGLGGLQDSEMCLMCRTPHYSVYFPTKTQSSHTRKHAHQHQSRIHSQLYTQMYIHTSGTCTRSATLLSTGNIFCRTGSATF